MANKFGKLVKVGRYSVKDAKGFIFDGCHKIYLLRTDSGVSEVENEGRKVFPMSRLEKTFGNSCPLRFINWYEGLECVVPQCASRVTFTYATGKSVVKFSH